MFTPPAIYLGADHAGFALKEELKAVLEENRIPVRDFTPEPHEGDDYPAIGFAVADAVAQDPDNTRGVLVCGSGVGVCIAANRVEGVRAFVAHDDAEVKLARAHDDANVICFAGRAITAQDAARLLHAFIETETSPELRHRRHTHLLDGHG